MRRRFDPSTSTVKIAPAPCGAERGLGPEERDLRSVGREDRVADGLARRALAHDPESAAVRRAHDVDAVARAVVDEPLEHDEPAVGRHIAAPQVERWILRRLQRLLVRPIRLHDRRSQRVIGRESLVVRDQDRVAARQPTRARRRDPEIAHAAAVHVRREPARVLRLRVPLPVQDGARGRRGRRNNRRSIPQHGSEQSDRADSDRRREESGLPPLPSRPPDALVVESLELDGRSEPLRAREGPTEFVGCRATAFIEVHRSPRSHRASERAPSARRGGASSRCPRPSATPARCRR